VPTFLKTAQHAKLKKAADVKAVGGRVETYVRGEPLGVEAAHQSRVRHLMDELSEFEISRE
jgi:hypothetical protein